MGIFLLKCCFWLGLALVFYTYLGYGLVLWVFLRLRRNQPSPPGDWVEWPEVTFIVCAYNEAGFIREKIANSIAVDYPATAIRFIFVTDGSTDATPELVRSYPFPAGLRWELLHESARRGKIAAFQRAMEVVESPLVVSTDANTAINPEAVKRLVRHFTDPQVGAVAGEKRIAMPARSAASSAGEGIYWQYESTLKRMDAAWGNVLGAAGELFAFRVAAYEPVPADTLVEDFYMTMRMAQRGWRLAYEPGAFAVESASASVREELKRKVRIAAGGLQAVVRLAPLLNIYRYGKLSFQYISHRVLRWTLAPMLLPLIFAANAGLVWLKVPGYTGWLIAQGAFYTAALAGWLLAARSIKIKVFFVPYYFCVMNWAMYAGFFRLIRGKQSVVWEKAERAHP